MLQNWLRPIALKDLVNLELADFQMGKKIRIFSGILPELKDTNVAILGIGEKDANAVRSELYQMSFPFDSLKIADLGNVRKNQVAFIISLIKELMDSKIFPLIIGNDPKFIQAQYQAFQSLRQLTSLIVVDERIHFDLNSKEKSKYYLNEIIKGRKSKLYHLGLIGYQGHFISARILEYAEKRNFECVRLGKARQNLVELEPIIRDGDLLSLNIAALRQSDAPGQSRPSPSGFFLEEACQIARYAGMSDKLKSFGLYGFRKALDRKNHTAQAVAQMLWYFLDGFYSRKEDFPASMDGLVEYIVELKDQHQQIVFWKSTKSGRWWMQVPVKIKDKYRRHRLIPCSYNDYKKASQEELPDRLLKAFKRFS